MIKSHNRTIGVITILLMLGASPLSVTYSFADTVDNQEDKKGQNDPKSEKSIKKERLKAILTEKGLQFFQEFKKFQGLVESMNLRY